MSEAEGATTKHNAAPLAPLVDAFEQTMRATIALGHELAPGDWDRPTECPGWTVKDQYSHLVGLERGLLGDAKPDHPLPALPHMVGEMAAFTELDVDYRRPWSGPQVLAELEETLERRLAVLRDPALTMESLIVSPFGMRPGRITLGVRTFDCWAHGEDVRRAVGRPADLDSPAAGVAVAWIRRALPRVLGVDAGLEPGTTVVIEVEGPHGFVQALGVDSDGQGEVLERVPEEPTVRLRLATEAFTRRACGRWPVEATPVAVEGDEQAARAVLAALAITP
jgi:uncharacterized protein (TIGR03083 family)